MAKKRQAAPAAAPARKKPSGRKAPAAAPAPTRQKKPAAAPARSKKTSVPKKPAAAPKKKPAAAPKKKPSRKALAAEKKAPPKRRRQAEPAPAAAPAPAAKPPTARRSSRLRPEALAAVAKAQENTRRDFKPARQGPNAIGADGLPYPLLRDAENRLDGTRLRPDEAWPVRVVPREDPESDWDDDEGYVGSPISGEIPLATMVIPNLQWTNRQPSEPLSARLASYPPYGSPGYSYATSFRAFCVYDSEDRVCAFRRTFEDYTFGGLYKKLRELDCCSNEYRSNQNELRKGRVTRRGSGVAMEIFLTDHGWNGNFNLDDQLDEQRPWSSDADHDEALRGDAVKSSANKAFSNFVKSVVFRYPECSPENDDANQRNAWQAPEYRMEALCRLGPDDCNLSLNRFLGVVPREKSTEFKDSIEAFLAAATTDDDGSPCADGQGASRACHGAMQSLLLPYQDRGVGWMVRRETAPDHLSLHPAWTQQVSDDGSVWYLHRLSSTLSRSFFPAPVAHTCGGMLCDDVGLGKSIQVLGLVLSNPAPEGWAVEKLPARTDEPVPCKATLLVCPAVLLPQWEQEIEKHTRPGALTFSTYLGISASAKKDRGSDDDLVDDDSTRDHEVMARMPSLFADGDADLASCDIVLCSFETLRDELRKVRWDESHDGLPISTPLGALGFWCVVLDEAQIVAQTTSKAAMMCSSLMRRHAWVVTGTPITKSADEIQGLLAFLGVAPFTDKYVFDQLYRNPLKWRNTFAVGCERMPNLLRGLMLRRGKEKPGIKAQTKLPPLIWETETLVAAPAERAAVRVALDQLRKSYRAFERSRGGTDDQGSRRRAGRGAAKAIGRLNGDLTRLRQTVCHPATVNTQRTAAASDGVLDDEGNALSMDQVLQKLATKSEKELATAATVFLRAKAINVITFGDGKEATFRTDAVELRASLDNAAATKAIDAMLKKLKSNWSKVSKALRVAKDAGSDDDDSDDDEESEASDEETAPGAKRDQHYAQILEATARKLFSRCGKAGAQEAGRELEDKMRSELRDKHSSLCYLRREMANAEKEKDKAAADAVEEDDDDDDDAAEVHQCPICLDERTVDSQWCVAPCGHGGCYECVGEWVRRERSCPICKKSMSNELLLACSVRPVDDKDKKAAEDAPSSDVAEAAAAGEWGTKLSALVTRCAAAKKKKEKVVVFSAWTRLLKLAASALEAHNIDAASLGGSADAKREALKRFKDATVLLIPLYGGASGQGGGGAAGLTLTSASTAVLLEPALQPGIERQAAGRISRIGQKKTCKVVRLIVKDTIEEKILEWSARRVEVDSRGGAALKLNDFVQLGIV